MTNLNRVVRGGHKLETLLRRQYHASGGELLEMVDDCESRLPHTTVEKLRQVASVHHDALQGQASYDVSQDFFALCKECEQALRPRSYRAMWGMALLLVVLSTLAAFAFYYHHWDVLSAHFPFLQ
ncbi:MULTISPECIES: DUF4145 domain-containing protein [unclassified Vibrio]|uniref:DUF4145 domain-containing protein n=1 Tax=Vibrio sp. HB236076 TaxID=3232307 RepID=A0AB39HE85_9VIBR|nr:DUF4145 domain-containing protein [Vibrio sp. HB161653]MDP5255724.1 DUF4145 domain-containing protein [Vibrio sp. HB161653]